MFLVEKSDSFAPEGEAGVEDTLAGAFCSVKLCDVGLNLI
jgi:hypothetical protein